MAGVPNARSGNECPMSTHIAPISLRRSKELLRICPGFDRLGVVFAAFDPGVGRTDDIKKRSDGES